MKLYIVHRVVGGYDRDVCESEALGAYTSKERALAICALTHSRMSAVDLNSVEDKVVKLALDSGVDV